MSDVITTSVPGKFQISPMSTEFQHQQNRATTATLALTAALTALLLAF